MAQLSIWLKHAKTIFQSAAIWITKSASIGNIAAMTWIASWVIIGILVVQDISRDLVTIEPISVPKTLSDNGVTPEVTSHRLRDALNNYAAEAGSFMEGLNVAARDELPDFVVPKVGLSLSAVASSIRSILHYGGGQNISGEITLYDKVAWLRLRVNGQEVFTNSAELSYEGLDGLLTAAVPAVMEKIRPYLVASALFDSDRKRGLEKAEDIIDRLKGSDVNVQWSYVLKGNYFNSQKTSSEAEAKAAAAHAEEALRKAIGLNWSNWSAHNNLGNTLLKQGKLEMAIAQYHRAIEINSKAALAHNNLGRALQKQGKMDDATREFQSASTIYNNLGNALRDQGKLDHAIKEYRFAVDADPKNRRASDNLNSALREKN